MSKPKTMKIDDVEYVRADSVARPPAGRRVIAVLDKGWIMVGYLESTNGYSCLTDCYNLRRWEKGGWGLVTGSPKEAKVHLDKSADLRFVEGSELFFVPISAEWGC